jgi:hypothetical protein
MRANQLPNWNRFALIGGTFTGAISLGVLKRVRSRKPLVELLTPTKKSLKLGIASATDFTQNGSRFGNLDQRNSLF